MINELYCTLKCIPVLVVRLQFTTSRIPSTSLIQSNPIRCLCCGVREARARVSFVPSSFFIDVRNERTGSKEIKVVRKFGCSATFGGGKSAMTTLACLVEIEGTDTKRKFQFDVHDTTTLKKLKDAIKECPLLSSKLQGMDAVFKMHDKDFDCLVTLADNDIIPHLGTVQVCTTDNIRNDQGEKVAPPRQATLVPDAAGIEPLPSCAVVDDTCPQGNSDGLGFELPDFGGLHSSVAAVSSSNPLKSSLQIKIVELMYQSMIKATLYPSRAFYYKVVTQLLQRYPHLADVIGDGLSSWIVALKNKFKNERRTLHTNEEVQGYRTKFGSRKRDSQKEPAQLELERTRRQSTPTVQQREDVTSLECHEQWLKNEMKKKCPDEQQIKIRMAATNQTRCADLAVMPVHLSMEKYPYIRDLEWFFNDFECLTGLKAVQLVQSGIEEVARLALQGTICTSASLTETLQQIPYLDECATRKKHLQALAVVRILCRCLRETDGTLQLFVHEDADYNPPTPCIHYTGESLEQAQHMHLYVEKEELFRVTGAEEGVAAVFAAYWIFQAKYHAKVINIMTFIENGWYKLKATKPRASVVRLLNKTVSAS